MSSSPMSMKKRKREQPSHTDENDHIMLGRYDFLAITRVKDRVLTRRSTQHTLESRPLYNIELVDHATNTIPSQPQLLFLKPRSMKSSRTHDAKRQRILLSGLEASNRDSSNIHAFAGSYDIVSDSKTHNNHTSHHASATSIPYRKIDLSPCHICHQKPKVKTDLDSYADCDGCGRRTCYICMRECEGPSVMAYADGIDADEDQMSYSLQLLSDGGHDQGAGQRDESGGETSRGKSDGMGHEWPRSRGGPSGHRGMVCSRCCVERGPDGEVRCLGCLRTDEAG
jgi:hypothetical protein